MIINPCTSMVSINSADMHVLLELLISPVCVIHCLLMTYLILSVFEYSFLLTARFIVFTNNQLIISS